MGAASAKTESQSSRDMGWRAELDLCFKNVGKEAAKTALARKSHVGPLVVQKPFYPEGPEVCHAYVVHPPGGVAGGDRLGIRVETGPGAHALLTTPAAGKFYRSPKATSTQSVAIDVGEDGACEWLPQETIFYDDARTRIETVVNLGDNGKYIGWDVACLGLEASGSPFENGEVRQMIEVRRNGEPLFIETARVRGGCDSLVAPWGLNGKKVFGIMVFAPCTAELVSRIKQLEQANCESELFAASLVGGEVLLCRFLGDHAFSAFKFFSRAWEIARPEIVGKPPCPPRIWRT